MHWLTRATGRAPARAPNPAPPWAARANSARDAARGGLALALTLALGATACDGDAKTARASLGAHLGGAPVAAGRPAVAADDLAAARRYLEAALQVDPHNAAARAALAALAPADVGARDTSSPTVAVGLGGALDAARSDTLVPARRAGVAPRGPAAGTSDVIASRADSSPPRSLVVVSPAAPVGVPATVTSVSAGEVVAPGPQPTDASDASGAGEARRAEARAASGVHAALTEYASALESRDLGRLAQVYPGMTGQQRRAWTTFFGSVADLRARLDVDQLTVDGATARARVRGTYEYENLRPRRAERRPVIFTATLVREGAGWRVREVE